MFADVSENLIRRLSERMQICSFSEGTHIVSAGAANSMLFLVLRGALDMIIRDQSVARLGQGEFYGEAALLGLEKCSVATLQACTSCCVAELHRADFLWALDACPSEREGFDAIAEENRTLLSVGSTADPCRLFQDLPTETLALIDRCMLRRIFFCGEKLQRVDENNNCDMNMLLVLVRGAVEVQIAGRQVRKEEVGRQQGGPLKHASSQCLEGLSNNTHPLPQSSSTRGPPVCFGELAILGMPSAGSPSFVARSLCHLRILHRATLVSILRTQHAKTQDTTLTNVINELRASQAGKQISPKHTALLSPLLFAGCGDAFVNFLATHLEDKLYLPGEVICSPSTEDDECVYLLHLGSAHMLRGTELSELLGHGSVFGRSSMLGLATPAEDDTIIANGICWAQILYLCIVMRGLELFPHETETIMLLMSRARGEEDMSVVGSSDQLCKVPSLNTSHDHLVETLMSSNLFSGVDRGFVDALSSVAEDRIFSRGDVIIQEGQPGDSMFIMISGSAEVTTVCDQVFEKCIDETLAANHSAKKQQQLSQIHGTTPRSVRIGLLGPCSVCGELAMLGVCHVRSATVKAVTMCIMWEITQDSALQILSQYQKERELFSGIICKHLDSSVPARMISISLFKGFDRKLRLLLGLYSERRVFFPECRIVQEGAVGHDLYVLNLGRALIQRQGITVKLCSAGAHFGAGNMLGFMKVYLGTLLSISMCHMLCVPRTSYLQALERYPSPGAAKQLLQQQQADTALLKQNIQRITARKRIWARHQGILDKNISNQVHEALETDSELCGRVFRCWKQQIAHLKERKLQREHEAAHQAKLLRRWVEKQAHSKKKAHEKHFLEKAVELNSCSRGPLLFPEDLKEMCASGGTDTMDKHCVSRSTQKSRCGDSTRPQASEQEALTAPFTPLLADWPAPRPSSFYRLKIWDVLADDISSPRAPSPSIAKSTHDHARARSTIPCRHALQSPMAQRITKQIKRPASQPCHRMATPTVAEILVGAGPPSEGMHKDASFVAVMPALCTALQGSLTNFNVTPRSSLTAT